MQYRGTKRISLVRINIVCILHSAETTNRFLHYRYVTWERHTGKFFIRTYFSSFISNSVF